MLRCQENKRISIHQSTKIIKTALRHPKRHPRKVILYLVLRFTKSLKKISLADNQFSDEEPVLKAIDACMVKNKNLGKYDFKYNNITEPGRYSNLKQDTLCRLQTYD